MTVDYDNSSHTKSKRSHHGISNRDLPVLVAFNRSRRGEGTNELREVAQAVTGTMLGFNTREPG